MARQARRFAIPADLSSNAKGALYRQVNRSYAADYDRLLSSGLYAALVGRELSGTAS